MDSLKSVLSRDSLYLICFMVLSDFPSGLKQHFHLIANFSSELLDETMQRCGSIDDTFLMEIKGDSCRLIYLVLGGGGSKTLKNCRSVLQWCENNQCQPLLDGKTNANIVFRNGENKETNNLCPRIIFTKELETIKWPQYDWSRSGTPIFFGY